MNIETRLAWRNLWRHSRRTWLTAGAMIFSNIILVFLIALQFGTYSLMITNSLKLFSGYLQIQAEGYLDEPKMRTVVENVEALAADARSALGTDSVAARAAGFALLSSEQRSYGAQVFGVEPDYEPLVSTLPGLITEGRYLTPGNKPELVIGATFARNLKVGTGDELTLLGSGRDGSFAAGVVTVVGIFDSGIPDFDRAIAQVPLAWFQDTFAMDGAGHMVVVDSATLDQVTPMQRTLQALVADRPNLVVPDWDALQPGLRQAIQADLSSAWFMYSILIILVAFSVLNTQLMSVLERTREFGIIMSLGLTPARLARLVILETALMAAIGFVLGVGLGSIVAIYFNQVGFSYPGMEEMTAQFNLPGAMYPEVSLRAFLLGPSIVLVFSLLAALYPAARLFRLQPVQAMRAA